jgi:hypothetical protein
MRPSKYKDMMIADPIRTNGGSLSFTNMLMRQDGSVMTNDHIKELRERQGFCLTCPQGEPVQLFEIKKSKINPLFRGKEALDELHQSHNGICLKCNPRMDPHHLTRRESIRMLSQHSSNWSLSQRSMSRSRSSSPDPPDGEGAFDSLNMAPPRALARKKNYTRSGTAGRRRSKVMAEMQSLDLFANLARESSISQRQQQSSAPSRQETPPSTQGSTASSSRLSQPSPGESVTLRSPGSISSLGGTLIQSKKVPINRSQIEEFKLPDFPEGCSAFKSHRKNTKKKSKETSASGSSTRSGSSSKSGSSATTTQHQNYNPNGILSAVSEKSSLVSSSRLESSQGSDNDMFAEYSEPAFVSHSPTRRNSYTERHDQKPSRNTGQRRASTGQNEPTMFPNKSSMQQDPFGNSSLFLDDIKDSTGQRGTSTGQNEPTMVPNKSLMQQDPFGNLDDIKDSEDIDRTQQLFSSSCESMVFSGSSGDWSAAFPGGEGMGSGDENLSWPAPPSIATTTDSRKTMRGSNASDDGSFLGPPSQASSHGFSVSRESMEQSFSLTDALINMKKGPSEDFRISMSPSQLIKADAMRMSGISKTQSASVFGASFAGGGAGMGYAVAPTDIAETDLEEMSTLLQDVAAGGNSEIMIDMLAGTIREHKRAISVQELCLKHIWELSKFNEVHKAHVMDAGLDKDIVAAMKAHRKSKKVQQYACGCLWSLSVSKMNRIALARAGAVKLLFRALENFIEDEDVLETVFGALRTLSPEKEVREAMVSILGPRRVCRAMASHRSSTAIQRDGCAFLSNVAVDMENQMVSVVTPSEIAAVVRAFGDHLRNESVVSSACFALKNYTYEEKNLRALRRIDGAIPLLEDASKYSTKAEIRVEADEIRERMRLQGEEDDMLEQIAYLSLLDAMENPQMTVDQAVETILDVLKQYEWSEKLICYGIGSLLSLSRQSQEYLIRITQFDVLKSIVHTMFKQQENANIQERGCEMLTFLAQQGNRPRTMICDVNGSSILIAALRQHQENENVRGPAVGALEELSKDPRCAQLIQVELVGGPEAAAAAGVPNGSSLSLFGP